MFYLFYQVYFIKKIAKVVRSQSRDSYAFTGTKGDERTDVWL